MWAKNVTVGHMAIFYNGCIGSIILNGTRNGKVPDECCAENKEIQTTQYA